MKTYFFECAATALAVFLVTGCGAVANRVPVAHDDTATATRNGAAVIIDVLANDTDPEGDALTIKPGSLSAPSQGGTVAIAGGKVSYTPPGDYSGTETWSYIATNTAGGEASATVTATIRPAWGSAQEIGAASGVDYHDPHITVDGIGNALAVWYQDDSTFGAVKRSDYSAATGLWGGVETLAVTNSPLEHVRSSENSDGDIMVVFKNGDGASHLDISARFYDATAASWSSIPAIDAGSNDAYAPGVAIDPNGNAIAVWSQFDGTSYSIYANRYTLGIGWGTAQLIETGAGHAYDPEIAIDPNGNAIAVWYQFDGTDSIYANRYTLGVGWGTAQPIETGTGNAYNPQIAIDSNGNAIAVWYQFDGTHWNIYANRYTVTSGGWGTAQLIETGADHAYDPEIAIDPNGNAIAVWHQNDGTIYSIYANRYTVGVGWGTAQFIETGAGNAFHPQISIDPNGNATAVWSQNYGTSYSIYANRYTSGGGWGTAQLIETGTGQAHDPQIAIDSNGNAIAVWRQSDGTRYNIWTNRFW